MPLKEQAKRARAALAEAPDPVEDFRPSRVVRDQATSHMEVRKALKHHATRQQHEAAQQRIAHAGKSAAKRGVRASATKLATRVKAQSGLTGGLARLSRVAKGVGRVGGGAVGLLLGGITMGLEARRRAKEKKKGGWI